MQLYLYQVETAAESLLVGVSRAQLERLHALQPRASELKPHLDQVGYLAVWRCGRTPGGGVTLLEPRPLFATEVRTCTQADGLVELLAA